MTTINAQRLEKEKAIGELRADFERASSAVFVDYTGLTVETVTSLRVKLRAAGVKYIVSKNTFIQKALEGTKLAGNKDVLAVLTGPTGVAYSFEDPSTAAKVLKEFRKADEKHEKLSMKLGVMDTTVIPGARVEADLAGLPGKDELRSMLLATLMAPMQNLVAVLNAPAQDFAYVLTAYEEKLNGSGPPAA